MTLHRTAALLRKGFVRTMVRIVFYSKEVEREK